MKTRDEILHNYAAHAPLHELNYAQLERAALNADVLATILDGDPSGTHAPSDPTPLEQAQADLAEVQAYVHDRMAVHLPALEAKALAVAEIPRNAYNLQPVVSALLAAQDAQAQALAIAVHERYPETSGNTITDLQAAAMLAEIGAGMGSEGMLRRALALARRWDHGTTWGRTNRQRLGYWLDSSIHLARIYHYADALVTPAEREASVSIVEEFEGSLVSTNDGCLLWDTHAPGLTAISGHSHPAPDLSHAHRYVSLMLTFRLTAHLGGLARTLERRIWNGVAERGDPHSPDSTLWIADYIDGHRGGYREQQSGWTFPIEGHPLQGTSLGMACQGVAYSWPRLGAWDHGAWRFGLALMRRLRDAESARENPITWRLSSPEAQVGLGAGLLFAARKRVEVLS